MKDSEIIVKLNELLSYVETCSGQLSFSDKKRCVVNFSRYVEEIKDYIVFRISEEQSQLYSEVFWSVYNKGSITNTSEAVQRV